MPEDDSGKAECTSGTTAKKEGSRTGTDEDLYQLYIKRTD